MWGRCRADDGIRTRDPHLGKVMRYQLRYVRMHFNIRFDPLTVRPCEQNFIGRSGADPNRGAPTLGAGHPGRLDQPRSLEIICVSASSTSTQRCSLPGSTTS
jgi:hypothetical protein